MLYYRIEKVPRLWDFFIKWNQNFKNVNPIFGLRNMVVTIAFS
ncbi:hypothetical protein SAMN05216556_11922 [Aequorivita viscosa]|uniref:Uncharacterized protein n=1 Tax=Aequorivita viscosa TaxID=797419 RepID=A0A1M6JS85_9FLAO|nr:hypothetical protein SAMN05216556_11922 [Aequorivita viscosa]SHJ49482.1 hypothetical protein SAMN04487908_11820 [Aequorivita viscosa]